MKKCFMLLSVLFLLFLGCSSEEDKDPLIISRVEISTKVDKLIIGNTLELDATVYYTNGETSKDMVWSSSDSSAASISNNTLTAITIGTVTISAEKDGIKDDFNISIVDTVWVISRVEISTKVAELIIGNTLELDATVYYTNGETSKDITWSSSDSSISSISNNILTAIKIGTVTVSAEKDGIKDEFNLSIIEDGNSSDTSFFETIQLRGTFNGWATQDMTKISKNSYELNFANMTVSGDSWIMAGANNALKFSSNGNWYNAGGAEEFGMANSSSEVSNLESNITLDSSILPGDDGGVQNIFLNLESGADYKFTLNILSKDNATLLVNKTKDAPNPNTINILTKLDKLEVGKKLYLACDQEISTWVSDNDSVININGNYLEALKTGTVKITVSSGSYSAEANLEIIDAESNNKYKYNDLNINSVPLSLQGETWKNHLEDDLLKYWSMNTALGSPIGNFPTYRNDDGSLGSDTRRYPRMISRQVYTYCMGYLLTGDEEYLGYAKSGVNWLIEKAMDKENGGWYALLDEEGAQLGEMDKYAQDTAYCLMGLASYYFITRDQDVEQVILDTRDLIFTKYWDDTNKRIIDGMNYDLSTEAYQEGGSESWELVALLDQLNAYMVLIQPVLSDTESKDLIKNDMIQIADSMIDIFWKNGIFWGQKDNIDRFGTRHVDFGHTLKSYWMIMQIDKILDENPYYSFVQSNAYHWMDLAYLNDNNSWSGEMTTYTTASRWDAMWWTYAECDQFATTLNLLDGRYTDYLENTASTWLNDYVDANYGGVYSGRNGGSKQGEWKNGYHAAEHAVIMYITGKNMEHKNVEMYFAVDSSEVSTFIAKPYMYLGEEVSRENQGSIEIDGINLEEVKVNFKEIY